MTRYTINIGSDFPLGDDHEPPYGPGHNSGHHSGRDEWRHRRGFRSGTVLRVLFLLAIGAIVITHPIKTALLVGLLLQVRRAPWAAEYRRRLRDGLRRAWPEAAQRIEAWRNQRWACRERAHARMRDHENDNFAASDADSNTGRERGYRGFV